MAEHLINIITLDDDYTSVGYGTFNVGDRIRNYWDDSALAIKTYLENNTATSGGDLSDWGDTGEFETDASTWGGAEYAPGTLSRSSTVAHSGTYSALYTDLGTTNIRIIQQRISSYTVGNTYNISAWVYVPSTNPLFTIPGPVDVQFVIGTKTGGYYTVSMFGDPIVWSYDTWIEMQGRLTVIQDAAPNIYPTAVIKVVGGQPNSGGLMYIDDFKIIENTGFTSGDSVVTAGPNLGTLEKSQVQHFGSAYAKTDYECGYKFCDSTTLNTFTGTLLSPSFPYITRNQFANHSVCTVVVCDIQWVGNPAITAASSQFDSDGAVTVEATTSKSGLRYGLQGSVLIQPTYESLSNTSGTFTGLTSGIYTIWAVDSAQCAISVQVTIPVNVSNTPQPTVTGTYNEKYRMQFNSIHSNVTKRVKINERGFNGNFVEVKGGPDPFVRGKNLGSDINDKFSPLNPTYAIITLVSERDLNYIGLFSQDDRKFRVDYEKPSGTLYWRGFIVPSVFSEPYSTSAPYYTTIRVSDNLESLNEIEFRDRDGNKLKGDMTLMEILTLILDKLDLELPIRIGVNISEDNHTAVAPFEQTEIDVTGFREDDGTPWDCGRVLKFIMPLGATIRQDEGYWNIVRKEEETAQYNTRLYDSDGVFTSTGTKDPVLAISDPSLRINSIFAHQDHTLEMVPAYGKISVLHKLFPKQSIIESSGFEADDETPTGGFYGWSVDLTSASGAVAKRQEIIIDPAAKLLNDFLGNEKYSVKTGSSAIEFTGIENLPPTYVPADGGKTAYLNSSNYPIIFSNNDALSFSFKYRINIVQVDRNGVVTSTNIKSYDFPFWIRIGWRLKLGTTYFNDDIGWTTDSSWEWNYIWTKQYNEDITFQINRIDLVQSFVTTTSSISISFKIEGGDAIDFATEGVLAGKNTTKKGAGYKIRGHVAGFGYYYFILENGTEATSWPNIKRPSDYDASTNACFWRKENDNYIGEQYPVQAIYLDDVFLRVLPNRNDPPTEESISAVINENYKENLDVEIEYGDLPDASLNSKQYIYKNFFKDNDGNFTSTWTREAVSEALTTQRILLKSLVNQYRYPTFKISGTMLGFTDINFLTTLKHTQAAPAWTLSNEEFTGNSTGWSNTGSGTDWNYNSNNVRSVVTGDVNSKYFVQSLIGTAGHRISIEWSITRTTNSGVTGDWLACVLLSGGNVVQEVVLENGLIYDGTFGSIVKFSIANDFDQIGFYIRRISPSSGAGSTTYDIDYFRMVPLNIVRYYTPNALSISERHNTVNGEWMQLIPVTFSSDPNIDDSGEGNTDTEGGGGTGTGGSGSSYSGDYSSDYGNDFDTTLN